MVPFLRCMMLRMVLSVAAKVVEHVKWSSSGQKQSSSRKSRERRWSPGIGPSGEEVSAAIIDGPQSAVWLQAENRMHTARGALMWLLQQD